MKPLLYSIRHCLLGLLMAAALLLPVTSCTLIWDDDDCGAEYRVKFKYDYHMMYADAFASQVHSVTLYAFDEQGVLAFQQSESGEALADTDYSMLLDVDPGKYHLVVWAGAEEGEGFEIPELTPGESEMEDLTCRIRRYPHTLNGEPVDSVGQLQSLWHGIIHDQPVTRVAGRMETITVPLMKNTGTVRIILQQTSGTQLDASDFIFSITDSNGLMHHDNSLDSEDGMLTYLPYHTISGTADTGTGEDGLNVAIAELSTGRLMADSDTVLRVSRRDNGDTILSIPLIRYLDLCRTVANYDMPLQEYLDREDTFVMTFFLDRNSTWINTQVIINDWIVRFNDINA